MIHSHSVVGADTIGDRIAGDGAQRVHHVANAHANARHVDRAGMRERARRSLVTDDQIVDDRARRLHPSLGGPRNGTVGIDTRERFTDNAAREGRGRLVRFAGPYGDSRQPQRSTPKKIILLPVR